MTQLLMLDAAYPPSPGDLIADITTVGGQGAFLYVWGPFVNGSPAHVQALRAAGLQVAPIIVPGNLGGDPPTMVRTCQAWGFLNGPVFFDFERGSLPSNEWWDNARDIFRANGFHADRYGNTDVLGKYDPGDADWIAAWLRTGILEPLPTLPQGWSGWQFVNSITVNGHQYDASVMDASLFEPIGDEPLHHSTKLGLVRFAYNGFLWRVPSPDEEAHWAAAIADDGSNVDQVLASIEDSPEGDSIKLVRTTVETWVQNPAALAAVLGSADLNLRVAIKKALLDAAAEL